MNHRTRLGAFVVILTLASAANPAALLLNASGILTGATGVTVAGTLYNVEFVDGTCAAVDAHDQRIFAGCDATSDLTFTTSADTLTAGQALQDQVFPDGNAGNFDTRPGLTLSCVALIPFEA